MLVYYNKLRDYEEMVIEEYWIIEELSGESNSPESPVIMPRWGEKIYRQPQATDIFCLSFD